MLTLDKVYHASQVLKKTIRYTDMIYAPSLSGKNEVFLKTENLQVTGSFKVRGASYKIACLSDEEKAAGVVASSAGNHAQGVALSCGRLGIPCIICMPASAPLSKVEATKSYGAEVVQVEGAYDESYAYAKKLSEEKGLTFVHPFDDEDVIAGQGSIALEILEQLPDAEVVIVPIGGGGLISGVAYTIKQLKPSCRIVGVQAEGAAAMYNSFNAGKIENLKSVSTFADGIAVKNPGTLTYEIISKYVDEIVTVSEDEIAAAILRLIEKQKMITEGAGAVACAAEMFGKTGLTSKKTVCLTSGGNIDVNILSRVISRGLVMSGRMSTFTIQLPDKPGQLTKVTDIISMCGGNILTVEHDRNGIDMPISSCMLKLEVETRNSDHVEEIRSALKTAGYAFKE